MTKKIFILLTFISVTSFGMGSRPACFDSDFQRSFDNDTVSALAKRALKLARESHFVAESESGGVVDRPGLAEYMTIEHLDRLRGQLPWISIKIKERPTEGRCNSKFSADVSRMDALKVEQFSPTSKFTFHVKNRIEELLSLMSEINSYYDLKGRAEGERQ